MRRSPFDGASVLCLAFALLAFVACAEKEPTAPADPLAGLTQAARGDTAPAPPATEPATAGHFAGMVFGYEDGPDTLGNAVRLAGVKVTAFVRTETEGRVTAGSEVASTVTDSEGRFELPTLPGGEYVVTFVPQQASGYRGGWTVAAAWSQSGETQWVIMLPREP